MMNDNEVIPPGKEPSSRTGEGGGMSRRAKVSIAAFVVLMVFITIAFFTITVTTTGSTGGAAFPYTTMYAVSFPEGQQMAIGSTHIIVLSFANEMVADVDGVREKLVVGEDRTFAPRHARITVPGIPLFDTDFQILMKYKGVRDNRAFFDLAVKTEKQVPEYLLKRLLPAEMDALPMQP